MSKPYVVAILCSDIHLSHRPPVARSAEPDWYVAMDRGLVQLRLLQKKHDCPVVIAGDIFDKWSNPPELVNFAMDALPEQCWAIPGQHDLRHHSIEDIRKTSYWTLVRARVLRNLRTETGNMVRDTYPHIEAFAFPWGSRLQSLPVKEQRDCIRLAVVHAYCWKGSHKYKDAPETGGVKKLMFQLQGYTAAVFGDNHKGFSHITRFNQSVMNCGAFFRRKMDEREYQPQVGLLMSDSTIEQHLLDCSEDKFIDVDVALAVIEKGMDLSEFIADLSGLHPGLVDFGEAIAQYIAKNGVSSRVKQLIAQAIEGT